MISGTYLISGSVLAFSTWLFDAGVLHAAGQTFSWIVVFFFASAGASAGYLTVSEIFAVEIRAEAIAVFFAIAQMFGAFGTIFDGALIGTGSNRAGLTIGYLIGGGVMITGGLSRSSSASTPKASRWSRSRDRSPKSVVGATCHDAPSTPSGRYAMTGITLAAALARDSSRQVEPADNRHVAWAERS
jgi:hypothetical protein